ncbi:MAG: hypothetical protein AB1491_05655 [Thermodesulfobacteriota bacterium]
MLLIESYILRQHTRPTMEESTLLVAHIMDTHYGGMLEALKKALDAGSELQRQNCANLMKPDLKVGQEIRNFIISSGGERYLNNPSQYEVRVHHLETGDPPEDTCIALVFQRQVALARDDQEGDDDQIQVILQRGQRWEHLGHWQDAILCYQMGLDKIPGHPELLFRLGSVQMRITPQLAAACESLKKAYEASPDRAEYARQLAHCFLELADRTDIEIRGVSRQDLRNHALVLLERAAALEPANEALLRELGSLRKRLGIEEDDIFFTDFEREA